MNANPLFLSLLLAASACLPASAQQPTEARANQVAVNVLGAVAKPSRYLLPEGGTLMDALAAAGDVIATGNLARIKLIHKSGTDKPDATVIDAKQILNGRAKDVALRNGDTLYVPEKTFNF